MRDAHGSGIYLHGRRRSDWSRRAVRATTLLRRLLDLPGIVVRAKLRRLRCPEHGVVVEGVPFARYRAGFTRDFEDVTAFLATKTDKTTIARFLRVDWATVGRVCERVVAPELDADRLHALGNIGGDDISCRNHPKNPTLRTHHTPRP